MAGLLNSFRNVLKPGYASVIARKVVDRFNPKNSLDARAKAIAWCKSHVEDAGNWARGLNAPLWDEALAFSAANEKHAQAVLATLPIKMGGGGFDALIYFMTRHFNAQCIVETGVAAGFSSRAFLAALKANGGGKLYSSDFPYFRHQNPEQFVGVLVEPELRNGWTLLSKGDRANLPQIAAQCGPIDIFHFDSDKNYDGRQFAYDQLSKNFTAKTLVVFDDIQDNLHFVDLVAKRTSGVHVVEFKGKWIGFFTGV